MTVKSNGEVTTHYTGIRGRQATVQANLNGKEMKYTLRVRLRQEGGSWKIDNVTAID